MQTCFWLIIAAIFAVIEGSTISLVSVWFVGGALAASLTAYLGGSLLIQTFVFFVMSLILLIITRPIVRRKVDKHTKDFNSIVGKEGTVTKPINPNCIGEINVDGAIWRAKSDETIDVGEQVFVDEVSGVTAIVVHVFPA